MRKKAKSVLGAVMKEDLVQENYASYPQEQYVIDGRKFLQCVPWPESGIYDDVCNEYIKFANHHYPPHSHFIMDGYDDPDSVKVGEQQRRIKGNVARTIIFDGQTKLSEFNKTEFFNNCKNKSKFIKIFSNKLRQADYGYEVTECLGDADYDIAQAVITQAESTNNPVVLDASDTDILAMLVADERIKENLIMKSTAGRYKIASLRRTLKPNVTKFILVAHAMSGCDTTSALFRRGKTHAFKAINNEDLSYLEAFKCRDSSHDLIASAGEKFLLQVYNAPSTSETLNDLRYANYKKQVNKKGLTAATGLELKALPPMSDSAKYHSYRAYNQVQKWLGNDIISPTDWGWARSEHLIPVIKDQAAAPDKILKLISCGCKQGCSRNCECRKAEVFCTILCSGCNGRDCENIENVEANA